MASRPRLSARRRDERALLAARAPPAATPPRRQAWLRISVVRCSLPCDPPLGGHSCNGGVIPRVHRAVCDYFTLRAPCGGANCLVNPKTPCRGWIVCFVRSSLFWLDQWPSLRNFSD